MKSNTEIRNTMSSGISMQHQHTGSSTSRNFDSAPLRTTIDQQTAMMSDMLKRMDDIQRELSCLRFEHKNFRENQRAPETQATGFSQPYRGSHYRDRGYGPRGRFSG